MGVGKQQLVEIAKALSKNVKLLILDEPTAAINEIESENLLNLITELKKEGVTSILISHKLKEVTAVADTITVLRDGKFISTMDVESEPVLEGKIIKHMVGREIDDIYPKRPNKNIGEVFFEVANWSAYDYNLGRQILKNIDFNVRKGEIVGIAGLMGAGRTELALSIFGNSKGYKVEGDLIIEGKK